MLSFRNNDNKILSNQIKTVYDERKKLFGFNERFNFDPVSLVKKTVTMINNFELTQMMMSIQTAFVQDFGSACTLNHRQSLRCLFEPCVFQRSTSLLIWPLTTCAN